ncbi:MAG TPA: NUDIX hydrolase [bacterium]|nr:NUDIX hydrolase [bacterium]
MKKNFRFCPFCGGALEKKREGAFKRLFCARCKEAFYNNPVPAVAVAVLKEGRVLMVKRKINPCRGMWCLPGGFIEGNESIESAAKRELFEETGQRARKITILSAKRENTLIFGSIIVIGVSAEGISGRLKAGDDASDAVYFEAGKPPLIPFASHRLALREALKRDRAEKDAAG